MNRAFRFRARAGAGVRLRTAQCGAALIVALVLLVVVALVGLAAISTSALQLKATSNQYDRQVAFQSAEAALRVAAALIPQAPGLVARDCQLANVTCPPNPFADPTLPVGAIHPVSVGAGAGSFTASGLSPSQPQFVVESLGNWNDPKSSVSFGNTANSRNYGVQGATSTAIYYRITARSCDPTNPACNNRAVVTLQSVVKRN